MAMKEEVGEDEEAIVEGRVDRVGRVGRVGLLMIPTTMTMVVVVAVDTVLEVGIRAVMVGIIISKQTMVTYHRVVDHLGL